MTQRLTHVPRDDHIPFTEVFEDARAGKGGGKIINPNDPSVNPAAFVLRSDDQQHPEETGLSAQSQHERSSSKEENTVNHQAQEQHAGIPAGRMSKEAQGYRGQGNIRGQAMKAADGFTRGTPGGGYREKSEIDFRVGGSQSSDQSPNHPAAYQGRLGNRPGSANASWESKVPTEGGTVFAPATPGKSRLRGGSTRGDETPDRSPALPRFGAWDEKDPSSGEGFTKIFTKARDEKRTGGPVRILPPAESDAKEQHSQPKYTPQKKSSTWACCFSAAVE